MRVKARLEREVMSVDARRLGAYKFQSDSDPKRFYQVIIDPEKSPATQCNCAEYVLENKVCEHIERAMTCYAYGL